LTSEKESKKRDTTLIIAVIGLIGTVSAALLSSPVLIELIRAQQATDTPSLEAPSPGAEPDTPEPPVGQNQVLVFQEDFDDDKISGIAFDGGDWEVGKDKSNQVLAVDATSVSPGSVATAIFGPSDFKDGIIEFRLRVNRFENETTASLRFRSTGQSTYSLSFMQNQAKLGYQEAQNDWYLEPLGDETSRSFLFEEAVWYLVRLEARGTEFTVFIDNNRLFSASDNRLRTGGLNFSLSPGYQAMFDDIKVWELE
jgi:hypothetical protein